MAKEKHFPQDCKMCEHFHAYDMSVDDWKLSCDVNDMSVDECDGWMCQPIPCPLDERKGG